MDHVARKAILYFALEKPLNQVDREVTLGQGLHLGEEIVIEDELVECPELRSNFTLPTRKLVNF